MSGIEGLLMKIISPGSDSLQRIPVILIPGQHDHLGVRRKLKYLHKCGQPF